jgi:hypothetical protein
VRKVEQVYTILRAVAAEEDHDKQQEKVGSAWLCSTSQAQYGS